MKCVYCHQDKPSPAFTKAEHVIPQSFGVFKNNLTLINLVCDNCNQLFGNELELALARDTIEGALRFEHQIKEAKDFKSFGKESRIAIQMPEGDLKGIWGYRKYSPEHKRIMLIPLPQVGFLKGATREYFLLDALPSKEQLLKEFNFTDPQAIHYIGCDPTKADKILKEHGINVRDCEQPSFHDDDLPPKKWTQRRVGFSIKTSSKTGGVQWGKKTARRSALTGISRSQRSRWSQRAVTGPQRWPEVSGSIRISSITGSRSSATRERRLSPAKVI